MALWTPANLNSVEKWFDASDASTITIAGSGVGVWVDKSGSGVDAFQTDDALRPAVISGAQNGLDVLNFDGSKALRFAQSLNQMGRSVIMLFQHQAAGVILGEGPTRSYTTTNGGVGSFNLNSSYTSALLASSLGVDVGEYGIAHYGLHETAHFYINGIRDANEYTRQNTTPWLYSYIGAFSLGGYINAKIAEIIILDSEPTDEDRQRIEGYLAHKWGIVSKLVPTHPYYSAAPTTELVVPVSIPNAPDGARYRISNQSRSNAEIANGIVSGGAGISTTFIADDASVPHVEGDTIHVDITYPVSTTAYLPSRVIGQASASGVSGFVAQVDDEIYNFHGIDGSALTLFEADFVDDEIDIIVSQNFVGAALYAFYVHSLTFEQGIREWLGAVTAIDNANFRVNTSVMSIKLDNDTVNNVWQTDNVRVFRDDDVRPVKHPTTGGGGIDVNWRSQVYTTVVTTSDGVITGDIADLSSDLSEIKRNQTLAQNSITILRKMVKK